MRIILASQSPRRKSLLQHMGLTFDVIPSNFDEQLDQSRPPEEVVMEIAAGKARKIANRFTDAIVIASDSIVVFNGRQLGKAADEAQARNVLQSYSESSCAVMSAIAVFCQQKSLYKTEVDSASIHFTRISQSDIDAYISTGDYHDKAGSFAVQHPMIRKLIKRIDGRSDTVLGMPTQKLAELLTGCELTVTPMSGGNDLYSLEF